MKSRVWLVSLQKCNELKLLINKLCYLPQTSRIRSIRSYLSIHIGLSTSTVFRIQHVTQLRSSGILMYISFNIYVKDIHICVLYKNLYMSAFLCSYMCITFIHIVYINIHIFQLIFLFIIIENFLL